MELTIATRDVGDVAVVEVTGTTAAFIDISKRLSERLMVFIAAVVLLSFVLLTAVFRSPLVALKAAQLKGGDRVVVRAARGPIQRPRPKRIMSPDITPTKPTAIIGRSIGCDRPFCWAR